jgi:UDP-N-acetyl-D-glucosamine dehydrogenase
MPTALQEKIKSRTAQVAVVGIGYVGLPLAVEMAQAGFKVVGYDKSAEKVKLLAAGTSYIGDITDATLAPLVKSGKLTSSNDPDCLAKADVVVICVPTPLNKTKDPDNSYIMAAADDLVPRLHKDVLIVLESTTFPGFTREILVPRLEETGLKTGTDIFVAFSPERVDPGNAKFQTKNTPKVVGGHTKACTETVTLMYGQVLEKIVSVSSTDAAEMCKLLENTFRAVNIGLVNEVAIMCEKLGLNAWEVIDAAATKPFGYMAFYPGPGIGGHCIPLDPHYLSWKLKTLKYQARFIELADSINSSMPHVVVTRLAEALNDRERAVKGSKILVLGVAYKRDINDERESPSLDIIELLRERGAKVSYHDPHIPHLRQGHGVTQAMDSVPLENLGQYDACLIITDHRAVDYAKLCAEARLVFDTRNATKAFKTGAKAQVITL